MKLNEDIESVRGRWAFNRDAETGKATLDFWGVDGDAPIHRIPVTLDDMEDLQTLFPQMSKHLSHLEIERKFVLQKLPHAIPDDVIVMNQYYGQKGDLKFRIRQSLGLVSGIHHTHTLKTLVTDGVFIEDERDISGTEFQELRALCNKVIKKTRFVYEITGENLKWEVDNYHDLDLVTAEIELPHLEYPYLTESFIEDVMDKEVTGKVEYFNSNMAVDYTHIKQLDEDEC